MCKITTNTSDTQANKEFSALVNYTKTIRTVQMTPTISRSRPTFNEVMTSLRSFHLYSLKQFPLNISSVLIKDTLFLCVYII